MKKIIISTVLIITVAVSALTCAVSFGAKDIRDKSRMALGYSIINGYSKLSARSGLTSYSQTAVFSAPDLGNPYTIAMLGTFYLTHGVDFEKFSTDNSYAVSLAEELDGFLSGMFVKNDRARELKSALGESNIRIISSYDTVGLFIIEADESTAAKLMEDERADFVFAGGKVPETMRDMNLDGRSDALDAPYIQQMLVKSLDTADKDEWEYYKFAADVNGDKTLDVNDVTCALKKQR